MKLSDRDILRRLGDGESIAALCQEAAISRAEFDAWWKTQTAARVPSISSERKAQVAAAVRIENGPTRRTEPIRPCVLNS